MTGNLAVLSVLVVHLDVEDGRIAPRKEFEEVLLGGARADPDQKDAVVGGAAVRVGPVVAVVVAVSAAGWVACSVVDRDGVSVHWVLVTGRVWVIRWNWVVDVSGRASASSCPVLSPLRLWVLMLVVFVAGVVVHDDFAYDFRFLLILRFWVVWGLRKIFVQWIFLYFNEGFNSS